MTVSVIIPVYNQAPFLGRCLRSVLGQTRLPEEILVVDDGSTDGSPAIVTGYQGRVTLLTQQRRQGPSAARNLALARSSGSVIAFLDGDDWWEPEKLERQLNFLTRHPEVGVVHTATRYVNAAGERISRLNALLKPRIQGRCLTALFEGNPVTMSSVVVRRDVLAGECFDPSLTTAEDWDFWIRLAMRTEFGFLDLELTNYQFHDANVSQDLEAMTRGFARVMTLALDRGLPPREAKLARHARRRHLLALGDLYYDTGRVADARAIYQRTWGVLHGRALRLAATFLPPRMLARARRFWSLLRSGWRPIEDAP